MRRRRIRSQQSYGATISIDTTSILLATIISLSLFACCTCDDAKPINTNKIHSASGHVKSTSPITRLDIDSTSTPSSSLSNDTQHINYENFITNQTRSDQRKWQAKNTFVPSGNELWDGLIGECLQKPSFPCFQKNVYTYLDSTFKLNDVNVTDRIQFKRIAIDPNVLVQLKTDDENEISDEEGRNFESESPIEEVTDHMYGKLRNFMMSHNMEMQMPDMMFDGATFRVTPRGFEGDGALVKLEMIPREVDENRPTGRILFKKIKKLFKNKLILGFLAIIVVIKLIKIKIFWLLPLIVGVTAAKKMLLKFILFLFPALSHLFKLCSYYHKNYHDTKYHHHHHQINHLHTVVPTWYEEYLKHPHRPDLIQSKPPTGHPAEYIHGLQNPTHQHYPSNWEYSGPGLGPEYISDIHRNIQVGSPNAKSEVFKPKLDDGDTINSWGLDPQINTIKQPDGTIDAYLDGPIPSASTYHGGAAVPTIESSISRTPLHNDLSTAKSSIHSTYEPSSQAADKYIIAEKIQNALRQPPAHTQTLIAADQFYGPIVARIDSILNQYSTYVSDHCKEWLVCNMYKSPAQFSPHSNFLSAELSRDSSELQKPAALNVAVLTFYKYVKAARDGQDQKNCLALNPKCVM